MKSLYSLLLLTIIFISCSEKKKSNIPQEGSTKIIAVLTLPDSTKVIDIYLRIIEKRVKYDSSKKKDIIVYEELWGRPVLVPLLDSITKKPIMDSLGRPKMNPTPQYIEVNKDSINTHIENIPVDTLLSKKHPVKN